MENYTSYKVERKQCKSCGFDWKDCPGPGLGSEGCRYYSPRSYPTEKVIYNDLEYISKERALRGLCACNKKLVAELEEQNARVEELTTALLLAHLTLTEGMADVPTGERYRKCASMRTEAKRAIRHVLGMEAMEG